MKRLTREHVFRNHGDLSTVPAEPPLAVEPGETFEIETVDTGHIFMTCEEDMKKENGPMSGNPSTGPVLVEGISAGEVIAVHIEAVEVVGHCRIAIGDETLLPAEMRTRREDFVRIENGVAHFRFGESAQAVPRRKSKAAQPLPASAPRHAQPGRLALDGGLSAPVRPMFGCFGVVPSEPRKEPWHHGGNLDLPDICAPNVVHIRCERDGAWFACGDGHAVQGDGEINGYSLEVSLDGRLRIERSAYQDLRTILIETPASFITVGVEEDFTDSVRSAEHSMAELLAAARGIDILDAYQLASHVADIRLGPIWPKFRGEKLSGIPIPMCVELSKEHFA